MEYPRHLLFRETISFEERYLEKLFGFYEARIERALS